MIIALECHFLAQVKRNCRKLWETIALFTALGSPISICEYVQTAHGNEVYRRIELFKNHANLPVGWNGIQRIVKVRRWGTRRGKPFEERTFYVLSKRLDCAKMVADAIQGHWSIENLLHWTKDVNLNEDDMTVKSPKMVAMLVYLNNIAVNTLRLSGYKPVKATLSKFANKVNELHKLFVVAPS